MVMDFLNAGTGIQRVLTMPILGENDTQAYCKRGNGTGRQGELWYCETHYIFVPECCDWV